MPYFYHKVIEFVKYKNICYKEIRQYRKQKLNNVQSVLNKSSELIAFIRVYGILYDEHYNGFILNINNIIERYLQDLNSEVIDGLYDAYAKAKQENSSEEEIFKKLRMVLYNLPAFRVMETTARRKRRI